MLMLIMLMMLATTMGDTHDIIVTVITIGTISHHHRHHHHRIIVIIITITMIIKSETCESNQGAVRGTGWSAGDFSGFLRNRRLSWWSKRGRSGPCGGSRGGSAPNPAPPKHSRGPSGLSWPRKRRRRRSRGPAGGAGATSP